MTPRRGKKDNHTQSKWCQEFGGIIRLCNTNRCKQCDVKIVEAETFCGQQCFNTNKNTLLSPSEFFIGDSDDEHKELDQFTDGPTSLIHFWSYRIWSVSSCAWILMVHTALLLIVVEQVLTSTFNTDTVVVQQNGFRLHKFEHQWGWLPSIPFMRNSLQRHWA